MAVNRGHFGYLLTPGFRKIFNDSFEEEEMMYDKIFHVNNSEKDSERDVSVSGFGLPQETAEGSPIHYDDPLQGYPATYVHKKYTLAFKVTREMQEDDMYNIIKKKPEALGKAMRRGVEAQAAAVFNNGFNTSYLGPDGKPLFSTSHPRADAGTAQSNASSTGVTFSETNLETARLAMRKQLNDRGQRISISGDTLLVPIELEKASHLLVDSNLRSGTADNDANFYKGRFNIMTWEFLTSTTAWFLLDKSVHELNWFWRRRPTFDNDELFDTEYAVYKSTMRFSRGWSDWRGTWGSKGDGQAYSS